MNFSTIEKKLFAQQISFAGIDEAGRGPLAGPVVAAAVVLPDTVKLLGVDDSKKLSPQAREEEFEKIVSCAKGIGIGIVSVEDIDSLNIVQATMKAMHEAVANLPQAPRHLLIDGNYFRSTKHSRFTTVIKGDGSILSIASASIIAKVTRDRLMCELDVQFPGFGFARHKGYATRFHYDALKLYGPTPLHRKRFLSNYNQYVLENQGSVLE